MVDARDVAAAAAQIASSPPSMPARPTGSAARTDLQLDVAAVLSELLSRTITYAEISFEENRTP